MDTCCVVVVVVVAQTCSARVGAKTVGLLQERGASMNEIVRVVGPSLLGCGSISVPSQMTS